MHAPWCSKGRKKSPELFSGAGAALALSLRFPASAVRTPSDRAKFQAALASYLERGGQQLQVSIAGADAMRSAQEKPEEYGWLIMRVGGYSAYFTQLDQRYQDDMIARSEMACP
jgi:formate C-acetyltransferase